MELSPGQSRVKAIVDTMVRIAIGTVFLWNTWWKIARNELFLRSIESWRIVPPSWIPCMSAFLISLSLLAGISIATRLSMRLGFWCGLSIACLETGIQTSVLLRQINGIWLGAPTPSSVCAGTLGRAFLLLAALLLSNWERAKTTHSLDAKGDQNRRR